MENTPVTFEDVAIHRATILPKTGQKNTAQRSIALKEVIIWSSAGFNVTFSTLFSGSVQLEVHLMPATKSFEISENGNLAVSGRLFCEW